MNSMKIVDKATLWILRVLNRFHLYIVKKEAVQLNNPNNYESLLPNENSDEDREYTKLLKLALEMPKVNNIAITGPYGSGKSSFLRGFEKHHSQWKYLSVSLAAFKDLHTKNKSDENDTPSYIKNIKNSYKKSRV